MELFEYVACRYFLLATNRNGCRIMAIHSLKKYKTLTKTLFEDPAVAQSSQGLCCLSWMLWLPSIFQIMDKSYQNSSTMSLPTWRLFSLLLLLQWIFDPAALLQHLASSFKFKDLAEDASRSKGTSALELPFGSALSRSNACTWLVSMLAFNLQKWLQMVAVMKNYVPMNLLSLSLSYRGIRPPSLWIEDYSSHLFALPVFHEHTILWHKEINFITAVFWCLEWPGTSCNFPQHQPAPSPFDTQHGNWYFVNTWSILTTRTGTYWNSTLISIGTC